MPSSVPATCFITIHMFPSVSLRKHDDVENLDFISSRYVDMYQSCVATDEVVHGLSQVQFADRREHTKCIAGQQNDILWMRTNTRYLCIRDVFYWISCSCVFCMGKMLRIRVCYIKFSYRTL